MLTTKHTRRTAAPGTALYRRYYSLISAAHLMNFDAARHQRDGDDFAASICYQAAFSLDDEAERVLRREIPDRLMALNAIRNGGGVMTPCRSVRESHPTVLEQFRSVGKAVALRLATAPTSW